MNRIYWHLNLLCFPKILVADHARKSGPYAGICVFFFLVIKALLVMAVQWGTKLSMIGFLLLNFAMEVLSFYMIINITLNA